MENWTKVLYKVSRNIIRTNVCTAVLRPLEMLLVNVSVAITDCTCQNVVRDAEQLDERDGLWADLGELQVDRLLNASVIALVQIAGVVAGGHALLREAEAEERAKVSKVNLQPLVGQLLQARLEVLEHDVLHVAQ